MTKRKIATGLKRRSSSTIVDKKQSTHWLNQSQTIAQEPNIVLPKKTETPRRSALSRRNEDVQTAMGNLDWNEVNWKKTL